MISDNILFSETKSGGIFYHFFILAGIGSLFFYLLKTDRNKHVGIGVVSGILSYMLVMGYYVLAELLTNFNTGDFCLSINGDIVAASIILFIAGFIYYLKYGMNKE